MSVRALWIQVGLLFAVLYLALLWARPMITPDEARYGAMGADMLASGDWMKLRMAGFTYYEKPPLGTWLVAGSIACFGHNAFAIRLPCALAALTSALAAGMVARRATGRRELGPLAAMVQLTQSLKGSYRRFVLSNTLPQHIEFVFAKYPVLQDFDGHILSYEVGLVKPDRRIYELTMQRFGIAAERAVFIDDLPANVAAARATGLQAIHHKSFQKTRRELTRLGIPNI